MDVQAPDTDSGVTIGRCLFVDVSHIESLDCGECLNVVGLSRGPRAAEAARQRHEHPASTGHELSGLSHAVQ